MTLYQLTDSGDLSICVMKKKCFFCIRETFEIIIAKLFPKYLKRE